MPWGNIGFLYKAGGGRNDDVLRIGRIESGIERLDRLERGQVTVEVIAE